MMKKHEIMTLFEYNYALYGRLWDSISQLTNEQFIEEIDYAHGSIRNQMVHVITVDTRWRRGLQGDANARSFNYDPNNHPTRASVRALWDDNAQAMQAYVADLDEAVLDHAPPGMPGPLWQVLLHLVNHGTDHRAQILRQLHDLGAPTFDQDLIIHLWMS
jgi:uncharacterized damage-inducible protein DinB